MAACNGDPDAAPAGPAERAAGTLTSALQACGVTRPPVPRLQEGDSAAAATLPPGVQAQQVRYRLRIHAVQVTDDDGGRPTAITRQQVQAMVTFANVVHGPQVEFLFDSSANSQDFVTVASTALNNISDEPEERPDWPKALRDGNEIAARHSEKVVVVFRRGPGPEPTGKGLGGTLSNFVIMPQFNATGNCGFADVVTLPHELGHHFGLDHTHPGPGYPGRDAAQRDFTLSNYNRAVFDNDRLFDTAEDPFINDNGCNQAITEVRLMNRRLNRTESFPLPRTNVMSYYVEGNSLSPQQQAREGQRIRVGPHFSTGARFQLVAQHSGKCLDVFALSQANDAKVVQWDCLGINQPNQHWRMRPVRDDLVQFVAAHSNKCLAVLGSSQMDEAQVVQQDCGGDQQLNQLWRLRRRAGNVVSVTSANSFKCLDVFGVSQMNEAKVVQWECLGDSQTNQSWRLEIVEPDAQVLANHTSMCLDVSAASTNNQADVIQWECLGALSNQQLWKFVPTSPGTYQVVAKHSGKCLDVAGGSGNGVDVVQEACRSPPALNQQWRLVHARGDLFQLVPLHSGKCLDVAGVGLANGTDVVQWDCLGNQQFNQLWRLAVRPEL